MAQVNVARMVVPSEENMVSRSSAVAWSAVFAGAIAAGATTLVLVMLGAGIGFTSVSPWSNQGASVAAVSLGAGVWLIVTQWLSSALGGYLSGRLRTKWTGVHTYEVFFRDTAHGFLAWALATLVTAALLTSTISAIIGSGTQAAATVLSGAAQGATQGAAEGLSDNAGADPLAYFNDLLFRTETPAAAGEAGDARGEAGRILVRSVADGELAAEDRAYLATLVGREAGIPPAEAEARVEQVVAQVEAARQEAVEAVDAGRKAAATMSIAMVVSLLIGAFIASVAAALGGRHRDEFETANPPI